MSHVMGMLEEKKLKEMSHTLKDFEEYMMYFYLMTVDQYRRC